MHIALVSAYPPGKGSLNEYGYHLFEALKNKHDVTKITVIADTLTTGLEEDSSILRVWDFNDPMSARKISAALHAVAPDAVIFNLQFASFGDKRVAAALGLLSPWLSKRKRPTITLLHNIFETVDLSNAGFSVNPVIDWMTRFSGRLFTRALLKSDLVALTLPRYVDILRENYNAKNVWLAPHGSFDTPPPIAPLPEIPTVMTFGKFGTYKKVDALLEAHARLLKRDSSVRLVIAGSDSPNAKGYLADCAKRYAHLPNVSFTGYVAEEDVAGIFQDSTVVAFPYTSTTGSSGVLHQAGQYGRAAVMPRIGDLADLIEEEGYRASYFEPEDVASLTESLWEVLSNKDRALELGQANHRAAGGLTLSDVADWYVLHFERLLGETWTSQKSQAVMG